MNVQPTGTTANMLTVTPPPSSSPTSPSGEQGADALAASLRRSEAQAGSGTAMPVDPMQAVSATERSDKAEPDMRKQVEKAVDDVQRFVETMNNSLQFSIDDDSGRTVVKVVDKQTDEVLRQIPSEEMLDIARALGKLKGLLVEQKV